MAKTKYRIWMWVVGALAIVLAIALSLVPTGPKDGAGRRVVEVLARDPAEGARARAADPPATTAVAPPARVPTDQVAGAAGGEVAAQAAPERPANTTNERQHGAAAPRRSAARPATARASVAPSAGAGAGPGEPPGVAGPSAPAPVADDLDAPSTPPRAGARPSAPRIEMIPDERRPAIGVVGEPE